MIKEIRILSGRHRGATLRLAPGAWRIADDETAAVHLSDWTHEAVCLSIADDGRIGWSAGGDTHPVGEHQVLQFGEIALSVGDPEPVPSAPAAGFAQEVVRQPARRGMKRWLAFGAVAVPGALLSTALLAMQPGHLRPASGLDGLARQLPPLLAGIGQAGLQVGEHDGLIVVRGVVRNGAEATAVRELLHRFAPDRSVAHLAIVNEVLAGIGESLREPNLTASYEGDGGFLVSGTTRDRAAVQRKLTQLAADFGPAVRRLDTRVTEVRPGWSVADSDSALDAGGLRYVQSTDGSKHFPATAMGDVSPLTLAVSP